MNYAPGAIAISRVLDQLVRKDRGRLLSALVAQFRDFHLAEEALHDALESAVTHWARNGLPDSPDHWLIRVAQRKALDRLRRQQTAKRLSDDTVRIFEERAALPATGDIPDERLRMMFMCCHPALERKSQIALTLRTLGGLTTAEIARCFLDAEKTMGQRLSRSKAKIAAAGIPFLLPEPEDWPDRIQAILTVIYLIYTSGHAAGPRAGEQLASEALFLARLLNQLSSGDPEIEACLALILMTHARRDARVGADGATIGLSHQNRALWHRAEMDEGAALLERAIARQKPGPFQIKAAIADCHRIDGHTDWEQIALLYHSLLRFEPTPVVRLNLAVAIAEAGRLPEAVVMLDALRFELAGYQPFHAAWADLLARLGRHDEARAAYETAITMANTEADRKFLRHRLAKLA